MSADQAGQSEAAFTIDPPLPAVPLNLSAATQPLAQETRASRSIAPTIAVYAAYGVLQALDAHSTLRALDGRGTEANPFVKPFASSPAALISFKAASTVGLVYLTERLRKKNRVAALALALGLNSLQAYVVAHNYRVAKK